MIETTRKCRECKNTIVLENDEFTVEKEMYYHLNCYVKFISSKKNNKLSEEEIRSRASCLREESKDKIREIIAKNHLYKFLQRSYDIITIPSCFFTKMDAVFDGTYKGMTQGICAEDILDMWERKWDELYRTYTYNISRGKKLDDLGRLNYDLAIILSKASSYYRWKETQKEKEEKIKELSTERKIDYSAIVPTKPKQKIEVEDYIIEDEDDE